MDALEAIMTTWAMRRFSDQAVADSDIETCLRAAQQAPSGGNVQPQQYIVVTDPDRRAIVAEWYRKAFDRYEATLRDVAGKIANDDARLTWERTQAASRHLAEHLAEVPAIVIFLQAVIPWGGSDDQGPLDIGRLDASVYPAVQNFCVAARALGLGTALTTVIRTYANETLDALGVPAGRFEIAALVPVGHPTGTFGVASRKPSAAVTHWNAWGDKRR